jgi:hypothetical protein
MDRISKLELLNSINPNSDKILFILKIPEIVFKNIFSNIVCKHNKFALYLV